MLSIVLIVLLYFGGTQAVDPEVISDEKCFNVGAKRIISLLSQSSDVNFKKEVDRYISNPFLTTVRYCLGPDGSHTSQDFVACLLSLNTCPIRSIDIVNWELCTCDTLYCILRGCAQQWIGQMSMQDLSCVAPCLDQCSTCILKQTGSMGKNSTTLATTVPETLGNLMA